MDTTKTITHLGLCAGYGGIELGLSRAIPNLRSVALCEIEAFPIANLVAKMEAGLMDAAPIWTDLKTFPWEEFRGKVGILSGGYPCQPFSTAGKRLGKEDQRHLWPFIADGIAAMRPSVCFFENVEGHISMGLSDVIEDLAGMGYRTTWGIFSAREIGAPHQRKRVFILAYANCIRNAGSRNQLGMPSKTRQWRENTSQDRNNQQARQREELADSHNSGSGQDQLLSELRTTGIEQSSRCSWVSSESPKRREVDAWPSRLQQSQYSWEPPRVVGNSKRIRLESTRDEGAVGEEVRNPKAERCKSSSSTEESSDPKHFVSEAQSTLGRDIDGTTSGMGYAELCITCDNRTDELRLLGNGVVPATAERAFRTLLNELLT